MNKIGVHEPGHMTWYEMSGVKICADLNRTFAAGMNNAQSVQSYQWRANIMSIIRKLRRFVEPLAIHKKQINQLEEIFFFFFFFI